MVQKRRNPWTTVHDPESILTNFGPFQNLLFPTLNARDTSSNPFQGTSGRTLSKLQQEIRCFQNICFSWKIFEHKKMFVNNVKTTFEDQTHCYNEPFQKCLPGVTTTTMMLCVKILNKGKDRLVNHGVIFDSKNYSFSPLPTPQTFAAI